MWSGCEGPVSAPFRGKFRGPEQVSKFFEVLATTQSGQKLEIEERYDAGDQVITINGYSCVVNVSGTRVGFTFFIVKNVKVARFLEIFDSAAAAEAHGAAPAGAAA